MKITAPRLSFRTAFWAAAAALIVLVLVWAFRPRPILVDTAEIGRGELVVTVEDEGRAQVRDVYVLSAPAGGQMLRVEKEAGDHVHAGDIVARLLPPSSGLLDARTEEQALAAVRAAEAGVEGAGERVRQAQADYDLAATEARRTETLAERGVAPLAARDRARRDLRTAEAALAAARAEGNMRAAELASARARLAAPDAAPVGNAMLDIVAPVSGRVLRITQESATVVTAGSPILEIGDAADLEIVAEFLSSEASKIEDGAIVMVERWGGTPDSLPGRVRRVEPFGFTKVSALGVEEQRVNVIIDLEDAAAAAAAGLGHGWRVEAAVVTARAPEVVQAPVSAMFRNDGDWAVFVIEDGRARLRAIEIGLNNSEQAEVLAGLDAGEQVILYPGEQITNGVRVRPRS